MTDQLEREDLERPAAESGAAGWQRDGRGREYVKHPGGKGTLWRQGDETIEEALARDAEQAPKDRRPRRKSKTPKKPPAPRRVDLKELEAAIAEALQAPAMVCGMFGEEWAANHFTAQGPYLARNLILASEHNPWLRAKLEEWATGEAAAMKLMSLVGVTGALIGYAVPPIVYFANLPVPDKAREMFNIPDRREEHAESTPPPAAAVAA
ncbi:MAG TPA: hypothetical protein VF032_19600 [Thermoleophilaceae bacterium]